MRFPPSRVISAWRRVRILDIGVPDSESEYKHAPLVSHRKDFPDVLAKSPAGELLAEDFRTRP